MTEIISKAVTVFRSLQSVHDDELHRALVVSGIEEHLAARLVAFLPLAYCRLILADSGARFANTFRRLLPDGTFEEHLLSSEPLWKAVVDFADTERAQGVSGKDLLAVAARSAEFHAANQLLQRGSKLLDLIFVPPVLAYGHRLKL